MSQPSHDRDWGRDGEPVLPGVGYAGFWRRVLAAIIDSIIIGIVTQILASLLGFDEVIRQFMTAAKSARTPAEMMALWQSMAPVIWKFQLVGLIANWTYEAVLTSSPWQATPGKLAVGIYVTDLNGNRISFARATGRYFAKILSALILLIGFLMVAFTERKQGLHDMLAGTLVRRRD